ncbi:MAG: prolipoprotein diacylglyceryl transferase [Gammaproteobacteria bacterium]|nr:prolipoprotein diacylglyceryl transferase [Gammaproteobacteria bacterium]
MLTYPQIDPVAVHLGPLAVHWYGLMYLVGFFAAWGVLNLRLRVSPRGFTAEQLSDMLFYAALGIIVGGRLGYMLFYAWPDLWANPLLIVQVWKGGMSFHGGLLGVIIALSLYAHKIGKSLVDLTDFIAPAVPLGLAAGRIGNFINGELWGRVTDVPWAMVFPNAGSLPRHPSQLYEFLLEGVLLFIILWTYSRKIRPRWAVSGLFLVGYGLFRFVIEFFREPDLQIGYLAFGWFTEGQLLSLPMIVLGVAMMTWAYWSPKKCSNI